MPLRARLAEKIARLDPRTREVMFALVDTLEEELATRTALDAFMERTDENFQRVWEALDRLSRTVQDLAEAQKRTEQRVEELAEAQKRTEQHLVELAEAQKHTEQRLERLEQTVQELVEAQKRSEARISRLEQTVRELAEAQKRTEQRLVELAEAQKRTEQRLEELAEAQKRTEEEILRLARGQERNRKQIGGLSRTLAYELENEAFRYLPALLAERYGFRVEEAFVRTEVEGLEVNLLAKARKEDGEVVMIVGEVALRLDDAAKIRQVERRVEVVRKAYGLEVFPVMVCHYAPPRWKKRAEERGIAVIQSFEWTRPVSTLHEP